MQLTAGRRQPGSAADAASDVAGEALGQARRLTVAAAVTEFLADNGVEAVFGVPGGATVPLHAEVEARRRPRFVLTAHEGGASYMADCYARITGKPAACCATTGPGATNLLTGVAAARQDGVPMIVLTGMNPIPTWGRGDFQECSPYWPVRTLPLFEEVCKRSEVIVSEKTLLHRLAVAYADAVSGKPGPVHLAIPRDLWGRTVAYPSGGMRVKPPAAPGADPQMLSEVARLLSIARRPLILLGSGAGEAGAKEAMEVSAEHGIPVVATPRGKCLLHVGSSPYYLGTMGISAHPIVDEFLQKARFDVVIALGVGFGSYATNSWDFAWLSEATVIAVNVEPTDAVRNVRAAYPLQADAGTFATALRRAVTAYRDSALVAARRRWAGEWATKRDRAVGERPAGRKGIHPRDFVLAVDKVLGPRGVVMADSSSILLWATRWLPDRPGRRFVAVWGWASMGHVTAGAVGTKMAVANMPVVAMVGDGCFLMNGTEVATAAREGLQVIWVVNVNEQLGMIHYELRHSGRIRAATLGGVDVAAVGEALGAKGEWCTTAQQLVEALRRAVRRRGPTVIAASVDPDPVPPMGRKREGSERWAKAVAEM